MTVRAGSVSDGCRSSAALGALIDELAARMQAGEPVDIDAVLAEHPEQADELRQLLPALQLLADVASSGERRGVSATCSDGAVAGTLGDFRLIREVGRGGMGVVYEAEQISLGRRVALKVLPFAATMDPRQLQRFHNEARAAASLHHERIVPVYGVGCERGVHYYAMQFIDGVTLAGIPSPPDPLSHKGRGGETAEFPAPPSPLVGEGGRGGEGKPTAPTAPLAALTTEPGKPKGRDFYSRVAELIADAADALEHAHSTGVVHRDVKPGNLMLDAAGKLWVTDFGLARFGADAGLTMTGDLIGTLRYMAPEQALARHGLADHRVDVYGLGATLYELLTGTPAITGQDKQEILRRIAFDEPIALRKLDKSIPAELETIALKCLAKEPRERYATAGELAADLRRYASDKPITAKPPGRRERVTRWVRRNRTLAASVAVGLLVVALALAGSIGFFARERANRLALTKRSAGAAVAAARAAIGAGDLALAGYHVAEARGQVGSDRESLPELTADIDRVKGEIDARRGDTERLQRFLRLAEDAQNRVAFSWENSRDSDRTLRDALRLYNVLDSDDWLARLQGSTLNPDQQHQVREAVYNSLIILARYAVRFDRSKHAAQAMETLDLLGRAQSFHEPTRCLYVVRSACYMRQGNSVAANEDMQRSMAAPARSVFDYILLGWLAHDNHDEDEAINCFRSALAVQPDNRAALFRLAWALEHAKEYAEAVGVYTACLAVPPVQGRADIYAHRSACWRRLGRTKAADNDLAAALAVDRDSALAQTALGMALWEQNRYADELIARRRALALEPQSPFVHERLGSVLARLGQEAEAKIVFRRAIEFAADDVEALDRLGDQLCKSKRFTESAVALGRAVELHPGHPELGRIRYDAACASALAGCSKGEDAATLDDAERSRFRRQALDLLNSELVALTELAGTPADRPQVRRQVLHWQKDPDFVGVRGDAALAKLPATERVAWQKLWADVDALLKRCEEPPPVAKPPPNS
jgi:serine/threonine protein kinase/tetratricopeptide (TPR) repeat protein